jgi:hypothetical protein
MVKSAELVAGEFSTRYERYARAFRLQLLNRIFFGLVRSVRNRQWHDAKWLCQRAGQFRVSDLLFAIFRFAAESFVGTTRLLTRLVKRGFVSQAPRRQFLEVNSQTIREALIERSVAQVREGYKRSF